MARPKNTIYKLWDGEVIESYTTLAEAASGIPEYIAAHPELSSKLNLTAFLSTTDGAVPVFKIEGANAILEYLQDAGYSAPDEDGLG